jgi:hypothetical protein
MALVHLETNLLLGFSRSKVSTCLLITDPRSQHALRLPHKLPGMHYSANEQCQILFGTNATFCKNMEVSNQGTAELGRGSSSAAPQQVWILGVMDVSDVGMHVTVCMHRHEGVSVYTSSWYLHRFVTYYKP